MTCLEVGGGGLSGGRFGGGAGEPTPHASRALPLLCVECCLLRRGLLPSEQLELLL